MSFLPKPGEITEDDDLYELSGDEDNRLRQEYELLRVPSRWNFSSSSHPDTRGTLFLNEKSSKESHHVHVAV